jgi:flagellar motor component MotA
MTDSTTEFDDELLRDQVILYDTYSRNFVFYLLTSALILLAAMATASYYKAFPTLSETVPTWVPIIGGGIIGGLMLWVAVKKHNIMSSFMVDVFLARKDPERRAKFVAYAMNFRKHELVPLDRARFILLVVASMSVDFIRYNVINPAHNVTTIFALGGSAFISLTLAIILSLVLRKRKKRMLDALRPKMYEAVVGADAQ